MEQIVLEAARAVDVPADAVLVDFGVGRHSSGTDKTPAWEHSPSTQH